MFFRIDLKVNNLINKWHHYNLSVHGQLTIAKSVLISQYTYIITILDLNDKERLNKIQYIIDNFIAYNRFETINRRKLWISKEMLYSSLNDGGFNMIKIKDFFLALKVSWIHRYINGLEDHWTDLINMKPDLRKENLISISNLGPGAYKN